MRGQSSIRSIVSGLTLLACVGANSGAHGAVKDLTVWSFTIAPDYSWSDRWAVLTVDVFNAGDANVTETFDVIPRYRKTSQPIWTYLGSSQQIAGLAAGSHATLTWNWLPGEGAAFEFEMRVDIYNSVAESNEFNNTKWMARTVHVPPSPPIRTLIITDSQRWKDLGYPQAKVDGLMAKLDTLASDDPQGKGVVFDIGAVDSKRLDFFARSGWITKFGTTETKTATNAYVAAIDNYIEGRHHYAYPDLVRVLFVGSHEVVPMYVRTDEVGDGGTSEMTWGGSAYDWGTDMYYLYTVPAPGNYLTDARYADLAYLENSQDSQLTRELSVGRLVETPEQIVAVINNYLAVNGVNPMNDLACIGSKDFMDGARKAAAGLSDYGYAADTTLIGSEFASTLVPPKIEAKDDLVYIGGHGDYNLMQTDDSPVDAFMAGAHATRGDTDDLLHLPTATVVAAGCHDGALLPNKTYHEPDAGGTEYRDFPEEFAAKGAIAYLGATGFTWISINDGGPEDKDTLLSELLCADTIRKFAPARTIGDAYRLAANSYYYSKTDTLNNRDRKVLGIHQIYGIPSYKTPGGGGSPPGGWHFGERTRTQLGSRVTVRVTLQLDTWEVAADGILRIPGAGYIGDEWTPVLPVIRYTDPEVVTVGATLRSASAYSTGSVYYDLPNLVPTAAVGQNGVSIAPMPFTYPGFYPPVQHAAFVEPEEGGQEARVGVALRPVQFNPATLTTRLWERMVFQFEYDTAAALFGDSFAGGNAGKWTLSKSGTSSVQLDNAVAASPPWSLKIAGGSAAGDWANATSAAIPCNFSRPYRVETMFRYASFHWDRFLVFGHIRLLLDQSGLPILFDPVGNNSFVGHPLGPAVSSYAPANAWVPVRIDVNPAANQYTVRVNNVLLGTVTYQPSVTPSPTIWFEDNNSSTNYLNAWYDDFLVFGSPPPVPPAIACDSDNDDDVDGVDFGVFAACFNGSGNVATAECNTADLDGDNDVDGADYGIFAACFNGSGNPPACG